MSYEDEVQIAFFFASLTEEETTVLAKFHSNDDE